MHLAIALSLESLSLLLRGEYIYTIYEIRSLTNGEANDTFYRSFREAGNK